MSGSDDHYSDGFWSNRGNLVLFFDAEARRHTGCHTPSSTAIHRSSCVVLRVPRVYGCSSVNGSRARRPAEDTLKTRSGHAGVNNRVAVGIMHEKGRSGFL